MDRFSQIIAEGRLQPASHTKVVLAIMDNAFFLLAHLDPLAILRGTKPPPTRTAIMKAALNVASIDADTKQVIRDALAILPPIVRALRVLPEPTAATLRQVFGAIDQQQTIPQLLAVLSEWLSDARVGGVGGLDVGIRTAIQIVEDGRASIYESNHPLVEILARVPGGVVPEGVQPMGGVANADVKGAIAGAVAGCVASSAGCPGGAGIGAVGGALIGSSTEIAGNLFDGLFGDDGPSVPEGDLGDYPVTDDDDGPA